MNTMTHRDKFELATEQVLCRRSWPRAFIIGKNSIASLDMGQPRWETKRG